MRCGTVWGAAQVHRSTRTSDATCTSEHSLWGRQPHWSKTVQNPLPHTSSNCMFQFLAYFDKTYQTRAPTPLRLVFGMFMVRPCAAIVGDERFGSHSVSVVCGFVLAVHSHQLEVALLECFLAPVFDIKVARTARFTSFIMPRAAG